MDQGGGPRCELSAPLALPGLLERPFPRAPVAAGLALHPGGEAVVDRYALLDPGGLSDHRIQSATVRTVKEN